MDSIFKVSFKTNFNDINEIYLKPNLNINYQDYAYLNYIYKETSNNIECTFNGFFKDDYFMIICDTYNKNIDISINNKHVILIKLNWILLKTDDNKSIWGLDEKQQNNIECHLLPIRNNLFLIPSLNANDYLNVCNYKTIQINIKIVQKIKKYNIINIFKKILL